MSENIESLDRLNAVSRLVESVRSTFPDAKKFHISVRFEWEETETFSDGAELCPIVDIEIERS